MEESAHKVSISRGLNVKDNVINALTSLGGLEECIDQDQHVLIKPNFPAPLPHNTGATMTPEVILTLIEAAFEAGTGLVTMAESSVCAFNIGKVM